MCVWLRWHLVELMGERMIFGSDVYDGNLIGFIELRRYINKVIGSSVRKITVSNGRIYI